MRKSTLLKSGALLAVSAFCMSLSGCEDNATAAGEQNLLLKKSKLRNYSVTPALVKAKEIAGLEFYSLISSDDTLDLSPGYTFGGSADGMGIIENPRKGHDRDRDDDDDRDRGHGNDKDKGKEKDESFTLVVNHEDNFAVSRLTLDENFKPVKGEYLVNSDGGRFRLCSATLTTLEEHGFAPTFLTCGESGEESMTHGINPFGPTGQSNPLPGFGHWSAENALPLPRTAYRGKTVVLIGDDDSGPHGGQVVLYVGNSTGDLSNGSLYVLARTNNNTREMDMKVGQSYDVEFRKIENHKALTGAQLNAASTTLKSVQFGRVEDLDYRRGNDDDGREVYFNVTGQDNSGSNADYSRTKYGRVYRLVLDEKNPTRGKLEVILDGDDRNGPARMFQNPDNICVTKNYIYIQEDPNGYGDETHDAYIYQYNIKKKTVKVAMELDHRRHDPYYGGNSRFGSWEYGALIDVSDMVGHDNTFALCIQPHTWRGPRYQNPDGGSLRPNENQASQIILVKGLDR